MPGFSKARLGHSEAGRPLEEYCGLCVNVYGKQSGAAMCSDCGPESKGCNNINTVEENRESLDPNLISTSYRPTPEEVEAHNAIHMPYRSWCKYCVAGKADADPHKRTEEDKQSAVPIVSMDYCVMSGSLDKRDVEEEEERTEEESEREVAAKGMPILVMKDRRHKYVFATVVPIAENAPAAFP